MAQRDFEEVWQLLHELDGKQIDTLVKEKRSRIIAFTPNEMVRQTETRDGRGWKEATSVSKATFRRIWGHLTQSGFYAGNGAFAVACLVNVPELGVELVERKVPRTIVLLDSGTAKGSGSTASSKESNAAASSIVVDPNICSGKPTIRGTRIMVSNILGMFAGGYSAERVLEAYPELVEEDIKAALEYVSNVIDEEKVIARE